METQTQAAIEARHRLIEFGGRITQDLGMGRIIGQVMGHVYLSPEACSLDEIAEGLGLSKAAVSIATRQLESLGLFQRVWKQGDRRTYYRTVENFAKALQNGVLEMLRSKLRSAADELEVVDGILKGAEDSDDEIRFLQQRLERAGTLRKRADKLLNNPLLKLIGR